MDNGQVNAAFAGHARWRLRHDWGLARACAFSRLNPVSHTTTGHLLLRRWRGQRSPRPLFTSTIGFAQRPAIQVAEGDGVTWPDDAIYWVAVDRISPGGIAARDSARLARPVVHADGADVGLLPNAPTDVRVRQGSDGKLWVTWAYNPADEQVAPYAFSIYSDAGLGALDEEAIGTVPYERGRHYYSWRYAGDDWDGWRWLVLAETEAGVQSLASLPAGRGVSNFYGLAAIDAAQAAARIASPPASPLYESGFSQQGQT